MTSQGPPIHPPIPLLVRSKEFVVDIARSLICDANLNKCLEHEVEAFGDLGLFNMLRVSSGHFILFFSCVACKLYITLLPIYLQGLVRMRAL